MPKTKTKRIFKGEGTVHHDLFRLENAQTQKNISFHKSPIWEPIEHKHFFHTVDSDGKPQNRCSPTAGHFHYVEVEEKDGELVATCSRPMKMAIVNGKREAVEYTNDNHTHDVTYLQSEEVKKRVYNEDALKFISKQKAETAARMKNPTV